MAGEITHVQAEGLEELVRKLGQVVKHSSDLERVFRFRINPSLSQLFRKRFQSSGGFGGTPGPWRPLAESTRRARAARGGNRGGVDRPLWDTGALRASFVSAAPSGFGYAHIRRLSLERGSTYPTGIFHQEGTATIPDRKIVPEEVDPLIREEWARAIARYIGEGRL